MLNAFGRLSTLTATMIAWSRLRTRKENWQKIWHWRRNALTAYSLPQGRVTSIRSETLSMKNRISLIHAHQLRQELPWFWASWKCSWSMLSSWLTPTPTNIMKTRMEKRLPNTLNNLMNFTLRKTKARFLWLKKSEPYSIETMFYIKFHSKDKNSEYMKKYK